MRISRKSPLGLALLLGGLVAGAAALQGRASFPVVPGRFLNFLFPAMKVEPDDLGSYMRGIDARALSLQASGQRPVVLQIGALSMGGSMDRVLHNAVSDMRFVQESSNYLVVAVEPNKVSASKIRDSSHHLYKYRDEALSVVNGLVEGECADKTLLYSVDPRVKPDFLSACPRGVGDMDYVSSMRKEDIINAMYHGSPSDPMHNYTECIAAFNRLYHADNRSAYIVETPVLCHTPVSLMKAIGARPEEIVGVFIDAEGVDKEIVEALLEVDGFAPEFLQFESWWFKLPMKLKQSLLRRGYTLGQGIERDPGMPAQARNIIAVRRE